MLLPLDPIRPSAERLDPECTPPVVVGAHARNPACQLISDDQQSFGRGGCKKGCDALDRDVVLSEAWCLRLQPRFQWRVRRRFTLFLRCADFLLPCLSGGFAQLGPDAPCL